MNQVDIGGGYLCYAQQLVLFCWNLAYHQVNSMFRLYGDLWLYVYYCRSILATGKFIFFLFKSNENVNRKYVVCSDQSWMCGDLGFFVFFPVTFSLYIIWTGVVTESRKKNQQIFSSFGRFFSTVSTTTTYSAKYIQVSEISFIHITERFFWHTNDRGSPTKHTINLSI